MVPITSAGQEAKKFLHSNLCLVLSVYLDIKVLGVGFESAIAYAKLTEKVL